MSKENFFGMHFSTTFYLSCRFCQLL